MSYSRPTKNLNGLSGWLLIVGLGLVLSPIRMLAASTFYVDLFVDGGTWELVTTEDSPAFNPGLAGFIGFELACNTVMFVGAVALLGLFFSKHYLFPRLFIICAIFATIFHFVDTWAALKFVPGMEPFDLYDMEFTRSTIQVLASLFIWVPYMIVSERVSQTFVNGKRQPAVVAPGTTG